jgi:hypothetical protein
MSSKNTAVFGIYKSAEYAERAVDSLIAAGYPSSSISVLLPDSRSTKEFAHEKDTKAPEGTAAGGLAGLSECLRASAHWPFRAWAP